jgi:hypothetical protein
MHRAIAPALSTTSRLVRYFNSSSRRFTALPSIDRILGPLNDVDLNVFRQKAFIPEEPILITTRDGTDSNLTPIESSIPAAQKWFSLSPLRDGEGNGRTQSVVSQSYLSPFSDAIVPYELITSNNGQFENDLPRELSTILNQLHVHSERQTFHRFSAPLSLFLIACSSTPPLPKLYIAQAQIADLPKQLQDDLPTPLIVQKAGKGDIYDANIWLGLSPTYTPLHKDPNPNLFVQLASTKRVRLFRPNVGASIFRGVQEEIGGQGSAAFRGEEMMEGPERDALDEAVWRDDREGFEAEVSPGDALFIPKGWWHSIKSVGTGATASVNWWFR